jgi:hypothetical protein
LTGGSTRRLITFVAIADIMSHTSQIPSNCAKRWKLHRFGKKPTDSCSTSARQGQAGEYAPRFRAVTGRKLDLKTVCKRPAKIFVGGPPLNPSPVYHSLRSGMLRDPPTLKGASQGREAKTLLTPNTDLETVPAINRPAPFPFGKGGG